MLHFLASDFNSYLIMNDSFCPDITSEGGLKLTVSNKLSRLVSNVCYLIDEMNIACAVNIHSLVLPKKGILPALL